MAQKPGPNRSQELQEISQSIDLTMETLRSVKETLIKALGDTPVCPTCNQTLPYTPLEWGDCPSPPPTDTAWGDQIDIKQKKKKKTRRKMTFVVIDVVRVHILQKTVELILLKYSRKELRRNKPRMVM